MKKYLLVVLALLLTAAAVTATVLNSNKKNYENYQRQMQCKNGMQC